ncbi:MAG: hypothetical protein FWD39_02595 [Clostridiales bacterium]|nr:hypothetical protein [Clostridiales bacterium]
MLKTKKILLFIPFVNLILWFLWMTFYHKIKMDKYHRQSKKFFVKHWPARAISIGVLAWMVVILFIAIPIMTLHKLNLISYDLPDWLRLLLLYVVGILMGIVFIWDETQLQKEIDKIKHPKTPAN